MIKAMDSRHNMLADQKNALMDYIGVLTTEEPAEKQAAEKRDNFTAANIENKNKNDRYIEVCVFLVSGLKLAISVDQIGDIISIPKEIELLDQQLQQRVSGLVVNRSTVIAINTSILVMPNRQGKKSTKIIMIKDSNVGFTCDDVVESLNQDKNDICWRTDSTKRKWLAGTVVTKQMALLDVNNIIESINSLQ